MELTAPDPHVRQQRQPAERRGAGGGELPTESEDGSGMSDDTIPLPRALTAENGAKAALSGEFFEHMEFDCHECLDREPDPDCEICHGAGSYATSVPVSWTTIKAIWRRAVEHFEKRGD